MRGAISQKPLLVRISGADPWFYRGRFRFSHSAIIQVKGLGGVRDLTAFKALLINAR